MGAGVRAVGSLAAVLATSLLLGGNAAAKVTPTVSISGGTHCARKTSKCGTLIIHVYRVLSGPNQLPGHEQPVPTRPDESQPLRIEKLEEPAGEGSSDKVHSSWITEEHRLRVDPGRYRIEVIDVTATGPYAYDSKNVAVGAGQTLQVTLDIRDK